MVSVGSRFVCKECGTKLGEYHANWHDMKNVRMPFTKNWK